MVFTRETFMFCLIYRPDLEFDGPGQTFMVGVSLYTTPTIQLAQPPGLDTLNSCPFK